MSRSMGSHQSARMISDTWLTPPDILNLLGPFDLDPCCADTMPWKTASTMLTKVDDGYNCMWNGFVWMNPPYGNEAHKWMRKLADYNNGIALIFARTETDMFVDTVWNRASSVLFIHGRLYFHHADGQRAKANSGAPSVLVGYGSEADRRLQNCGIQGTFIDLSSSIRSVGSIRV